ncbi:MAG: GDSL-type esterase/lipase family protein [Rubripirellula sp.]
MNCIRSLLLVFAIVVWTSSDSWSQEAPVAEATLVVAGNVDESVFEPYREKAIEKWEKAIKELEELDKTETDPADAILFLGSSSIRRWDDIVIDMAPFRPIQRGYGGSKYSDVSVFAKRLIHPHHYRAMAIFVGNDVSGKSDDKTPDELEKLVRYVIGVSKAHQPQAPVFLIEVTPTEKRLEVWPQIRQFNARLREIALSTPDTHFIATAEHYLDPLGHPRSEYFVEDKLHLNNSGYDVWAKLIRDRLDEVLRETDEFRANPPASLEE